MARGDAGVGRDSRSVDDESPPAAGHATAMSRPAAPVTPPAPGAEALAAGAICHNCYAALAGGQAYCHACGQRQAIDYPGVAEYLRQVYDHYLSGGGRIGRTLRGLLLVPGSLAQAWNLGRRQQFVPPLRLYLVTAFLLFSLLRLVPLEQINSARGLAQWLQGLPAPAALTAWAAGWLPDGLTPALQWLVERYALARQDWLTDPAAAAAGLLRRSLDLLWFAQFVLIPLDALTTAMQLADYPRRVGAVLVADLYNRAAVNLMVCAIYVIGAVGSLLGLKGGAGWLVAGPIIGLVAALAWHQQAARRRLADLYPSGQYDWFIRRPLQRLALTATSMLLLAGLTAAAVLGRWH